MKAVQGVLLPLSKTQIYSNSSKLYAKKYRFYLNNRYIFVLRQKKRLQK